MDSAELARMMEAFKAKGGKVQQLGTSNGSGVRDIRGRVVGRSTYGRSCIITVRPIVNGKPASEINLSCTKAKLDVIEDGKIYHFVCENNPNVGTLKAAPYRVQEIGTEYGVKLIGDGDVKITRSGRSKGPSCD